VETGYVGEPLGIIHLAVGGVFVPTGFTVTCWLTIEPNPTPFLRNRHL
jgi:hypothetical protein